MSPVNGTTSEAPRHVLLRLVPAEEPEADGEPEVRTEGGVLFANTRDRIQDAIEPVQPEEWEPLKRIDEERYRLGQPNLFDVEVVPTEVQGLLRRLTL